MTKEEILEQHGRGLSSGQVHITAQSALDAMDEYAKQQSMKYLRYFLKNYMGLDSLPLMDGVPEDDPYDLFLKSK